MPSFALPEAALQSIPLPAEFGETLASAADASRVKTKLPKIFNPVFRNQGLVNRLSLDALGRVGESLAHLASEIESRDQILRNLVTHVNAHSDYTSRCNETIAHFGSGIIQHLNELDARLKDGDKAITALHDGLRGNLASLVQAIQIDEQSIATLQEQVHAQSKQAEHLNAESVSIRTALHNATEQSTSAIARLSAGMEALASIGRGVDRRIVDIVERVRTITETSAARDEQLKRLLHESIVVLRDETRTEIEKSQITAAEGVKASTAAITALLDETRINLEKIRSTTAEAFKSLADSVAALQVDTRTEVEMSRNIAAEGVEASAAAVTSLRDETRIEIGKISERLSRLESYLNGMDPKKLSEDFSLVRDEVASLESLGRASDSNLLQLSEAVHQLSRDVPDTHERLQQMDERHGQEIAQLQSRLRAQELLLKRYLREPRKQVVPAESAPVSNGDNSSREIEKQLWDAFYSAFEGKFRGSRELIKRRVTVYVDPIAAAVDRTKGSWQRGSTRGPLVVDLGCGRGEWLELLGENDIRCRGVDLNSVFLDENRARGLDVVESDALAFLHSATDSSLAGITSFHMVEHLPFPIVLELLSEAYRVLAPGGLLILETPNPTNLMVASLGFHTDPTHLKPLPPSLLEFAAQQTGFSRIQVLPLNPPPESDRLQGDSEILRRWNQHFYGPQDYAILATK